MQTRGPAAGLDQLDVIEPVDGRVFTAAASVASQNRADLHLFRVGRPITVVLMRWCNGGTVAGNVDVGVYDFDGTNYRRLASSGSTVMAGASALQAANMTASVIVVPGKDYWLAFASDSLTATFQRLAGFTAAGAGNKVLIKAASFPLPTSIATPAQGVGATWLQAAAS